MSAGAASAGEVDRPAALHPVSDPDDPRLADYAALTDAALRKRYEHQQGVLIAEGPEPVRALVSSPYPVRSVLVAADRLETIGDVVAAVDAPVYVVSQRLLERVVRFRLHQGVLACGGRLPPLTLGQVLAGARRLLVLEGLNDHENLGALFRTARAFGIDGVLLTPGCADPLYRRSVRVSMGHVLHVPMARTGPVTDLLTSLAARGITTVALTPASGALELAALPVGPGPVALLLGAEGPGLSQAALHAATHRVRIPITTDVDSLNVAAAGAIACYALATAPGQQVSQPAGAPRDG
ncbi:MAG: TrmH family RNA methyltransferase [Nitriliruptoraceae bacterium]